mgnify:CR=1 FL=1
MTPSHSRLLHPHRFEWLEDELEGLAEAEDAARVEELMGEAVGDYLSIPLWPQVVYERAVAAFPVTHYLWLQYARYLESHLKINSGELLGVLLIRGRVACHVRTLY